MKTDKRIGYTTAILVTYGNRYEYFSKLLDKLLLMQIGYIVIVNNNSHDESKEVLRKYFSSNKDKIFIINNEKNLGSAAGFSKGIQVALKRNTEFIWLLDDDLLPNTNAIVELFKMWDKITEIEKETTIMLLSNRIHRSNIYIRAVLKNNPDLVIGDKNNFRSLNIFNIINNFFEKVFEFNKEKSKGKNKNNIPDYALIGAACYGGMFFHSKLVEKIGLPDERYVLYYDDYEYSLRHIQRGGKIYFIRDSILEDQIKSWNNSKWKFAFIEIATNRNLPLLYYSIRNSVYFEINHKVDNKCVYYLNLLIYSIVTCLTALLFFRINNLRVYLYALMDGLKGKLGYNSKYPLA